ncbi:MAG: hypothetical protein JNJ45_06435 [Chthonomonas sp.]|nr:hypothetical protein [Chthonomonas sp.]
MRTLGALCLLATCATAAVAQINSFVVQNGWNNNTGTFSYSGTYPSVTMQILNQNNTANNTYGERFIAWLSADSLTRAKINGKKDFSIEYSMHTTTDAAAQRDVEGGLLFQYSVRNPGPNQYFPTSQYYAKFKPQIEAPVIQTSADWCLPFYDFAADGGTLLNNQVVHMKFEYDYIDAAPMTSVQRLGYRNADGTWFYSPWINGNWGGPVYDDEMELGIYFQPLVEAANPNHNTTCAINVISFTGTLGGQPTVSGTVGLNTWSQAVNGRTVNFTIYSGLTQVGTASGTLNASGGYSFNTALANGTYTVIADGGLAWLKRKATMVLNNGASNLNFTLPNGDIVNDGIVDIADYSALATAFDAEPSSGNWNAAADLNGDSIIDIADYAGLAAAFDLGDDTP